MLTNSNKTRNFSQTLVEAITLPPRSSQYAGKVYGSPAPFSLVPVTIEMDKCQRKFYPEEVLKYIDKHKGLNWKAFGYVTVVRYPDGTLRMINGRHRTSLAITIDPNITEVPAHIVDVANEEEAAILFAAMNGDSSKNLKTEELFWSQVIAKDPYALDIKFALEKFGLACGKVNEFDQTTGEPNIQVKLANFKKCLQFGYRETELAVNLIRMAYPKAREFDNLLSGTAKLLSINEYKILGNKELGIGLRFEVWFTTILPNTKTIQQTNFKKYRNTTQWYNGVAYGLYQLFKVYMSNNGYTCPAVKTIKEIYEAGVAEEEDEE
jgi:hypothetical protein